MRTASLYVRLSREAGDSNLSLAGMLADVEAVADREGFRVIGRHVDDGLSGSRRDRPEFLAWLADAAEGRADVLIAWHVDRMTREGVAVAGMILDVVEGKDPRTGKVVRPPVRLMDAKGLDSEGDETAFRFRFVIAAEVARAERERMRERSRAAKRRAIDAGRWYGGPTPFGARAVDNPDGPGRVLVEDLEEVAAIRWAAERLVAGASLREIALGMPAPPRRAKAWSRFALRQMLGRSGWARERLDPLTRAAVDARLAQSAGRKSPGRPPSRLLHRLLRCGSCGSVLRTMTDRRRGTAAYRCPATADGRLCPTLTSVSARLVEEFVEDVYLDGWGRLPEVVERSDAEARALALDAAIREASLAVVALRGAERLAALERLEALEAERDGLDEDRGLRVLVETGRSYGDLWRASDVAARRATLARLLGDEPLTVLPAERGHRTGAVKRLDAARMPDVWRLDPAEADARAAGE